MASCLMCQKMLSKTLTIRELLSWRKVTDDVICENCKATFTVIRESKACPQCGRNQENQEICQDCQRWHLMPHTLKIKNRGLFQYTPAMHDYMHQYKFNGDLRLAKVFQHVVQLAIDVAQVDVVIPVPVSDTTFDHRGFNQAAELLQLVVENRHSPVVCPALKVVARDKQQQSKQGRKDRMDRTQPFVIDPNYVEKLRGNKILIFDDVYTTGRTLHFAAQALQTVEATSMIGLTLAR